MTLNVTGPGAAIPTARPAAASAPDAALAAVAGGALAPAAPRPAPATEDGPRAADPLGGSTAVPDLDGIVVPAEEEHLEANKGTYGSGGGGTGTRPRPSGTA